MIYAHADSDVQCTDCGDYIRADAKFCLQSNGSGSLIPLHEDCWWSGPAYMPTLDPMERAAHALEVAAKALREEHSTRKVHPVDEPFIVGEVGGQRE